MMCFSHENADCNKYRNPSEFKQRPVTAEILEDYEEFESKIQKKKEKEYEAEKQKVLKEHKRQIVNTKKRLKAHEEFKKKLEEKKAAEKEATNTETSNTTDKDE